MMKMNKLAFSLNQDRDGAMDFKAQKKFVLLALATLASTTPDSRSEIRRTSYLEH